MTKREDIYRGFSGKQEADIIKFFEDKDVHCVSCKVDFDDIPNEKLVFPVRNSLSITIFMTDGSREHGVPYIKCGCGYENSILKLLYQVV